ncbi:MAG: ATP-binding protein [Muribaculaceae bacterium]
MAMALKNNTSNYQLRLFFLIIIFTWIMAFVSVTVQYTREREYRVETINTNLQFYNSQILNAYEKNIPLNPQLINNIVGHDSLRVTIVNFEGNVLYDTEAKNVNNNHKSRQEIKDAMTYGKGFTVRRVSETDSHEYFYSATKGESIVVRSALPYDLSLAEMLKVNPINIWVIILMASILSIIAFFATRRIGQSVRNLRDFAIQAEDGDINEYNVQSFPNDELGEISSHIINLYQNLEKTTQERDENLKNALYEEQEKTRIKHQLTNNINHELKTPVHAIQACLETIVYNNDKLDKETLVSLAEKSYQNVTRLCSLMQDIATITHITEAGHEIEKEPTNINCIISEVRNEILLLPIEKQMRVNVSIPENIIVVGNKNLLEAIFRNLINNAVAYSGGRDVYVELVRETTEFFTFRIWDNGIGVEDTHLSKIFERFYRIDSGRSRKLGGTGLGLAIVKNAVLFHSGTITVQNRHNCGLEFTFSLHK